VINITSARSESRSTTWLSRAWSAPRDRLGEIAREVGPKKITVNSIAPGRIETERLAEVYNKPSLAPRTIGRSRCAAGSPREVAQVACFLASTPRAT
jgi:NAD(P)-dependent dehydrogenase (short-subunit alcohol dehydrogenase family)